MAIDLAAWRARVATDAPGAHGAFVGLILAELADPTTGTVALTDAAIRRLVEGAHVHPIGLRRLLAMFTGAGLLRWDGPTLYTLTLPVPKPPPRAHVVPRRRRPRSALTHRRPHSAHH